MWIGKFKFFRKQCEWFRNQNQKSDFFVLIIKSLLCSQYKYFTMHVNVETVLYVLNIYKQQNVFPFSFSILYYMSLRCPYYCHSHKAK